MVACSDTFWLGSASTEVLARVGNAGRESALIAAWSMHSNPLRVRHRNLLKPGLGLGFNVFDDPNADAGAIRESWRRRGARFGTCRWCTHPVPVGVDHDVRAVSHGVVDPITRGSGQAYIAGVDHDVLDAVRARHLDRAVGGTVVDDEDIHRFHAWNLQWDGLQHQGQRFLLVMAG